MPIPPFDKNLVLPPHLGDPTDPNKLSPFDCTTPELVTRYATSQARKVILQGFLEFRTQIQNLGVVHGYQWLDGSFLEDIEKKEARAPQDLDLITVFAGLTPAQLTAIENAFPPFIDRDESKRIYKVDHFPFQADASPYLTVDGARYWTQLFTHRRDQLWKGMLRIGLNTVADDAAALVTLNQIP